MCGHKVSANESTSESIKELCHGCREWSICVIAVLVYQGYNDSIEGMYIMPYMGGLLVM